MTLDELNSAPQQIASEALRACCGSSRWVSALLAQRPFTSLAALLAASDAAWSDTGPSDWREAIAGHPRIGERSTTSDARSSAWSAREQSGLGSADAVLRSSLAEANREYEARFGHIFLVCAMGKNAAELLANVRERLRNAPDTELEVAGAELGKIARLRLEKLLGTPHTEAARQ